MALLALALQPACAEGAGSGLWENFSARDLEGRQWDAEGLRGRLVLLDFWATWCAPCLAELPHLARVYERFAEEGFLILGVSVDQMPRRDLLSWLRRQAVGWPQLWDGRGLDGALAARFGVASVPRSFLVDGEGRVVAVDLRGEALELVVESLLGDAVHPALTPSKADE